MYWTNINPNYLPVRDVIAFSEHADDIIEEHFEIYGEVMKGAVAEGVAEVLKHID